MDDLIQHLQDKVGITAEQAERSLQTIKEYVVAKFPMLEGAVENMFAGATSKVDNTPIVPEPFVTEVSPQEHGVLDKISNVIPGQTGEKIEEFAKNAAYKASEVFDNVKEKLGDMFGDKDEKKPL